MENLFTDWYCGRKGVTLITCNGEGDIAVVYKGKMVLLNELIDNDDFLPSGEYDICKSFKKNERRIKRYILKKGETINGNSK